MFLLLAFGAIVIDFDFVIVDTPAGLDELTLAALECATDLLLVSSLDVTSIPPFPVRDTVLVFPVQERVAWRPEPDRSDQAVLLEAKCLGLQNRLAG